MPSSAGAAATAHLARSASLAPRQLDRGTPASARARHPSRWRLTSGGWVAGQGVGHAQVGAEHVDDGLPLAEIVLASRSRAYRPPNRTGAFSEPSCSTVSPVRSASSRAVTPERRSSPTFCRKASPQPPVGEGRRRHAALHGTPVASCIVDICRRPCSPSWTSGTQVTGGPTPRIVSQFAWKTSGQRCRSVPAVPIVPSAVV